MNRLSPLTSIRFFAALFVVCFHVGVTPIAAHSGWLAQIAAKGYTAVGLFYALSGFVLAYNYAGRRLTYRKFVTARFARIFPAYLLALVLMAPLFLMRDFSPAALIAAPLMVQAWYPGTALAWNAPGWSVSVEAFFYLMFPLLLPLFAGADRVRLRRWLMLACLAAVTPSALYMIGTQFAEHARVEWRTLESSSLLGVLNFNPIFRLPEFVAGILVGMLFLRRRSSPPWKAEAGSAGALLVALILLATEGVLPFPMLHNGILLPVWCVLIYSLAGSRFVAKHFSFPAVLLLGEISYGMYILQQPVSSFFKLALLEVANIRVQGDYPDLLSFGLYVVLLIAVSYASHRWVELPARQWINRCYSSRGIGGALVPLSSYLRRLDSPSTVVPASQAPNA